MLKRDAGTTAAKRPAAVEYLEVRDACQHSLNDLHHHRHQSQTLDEMLLEKSRKQLQQSWDLLAKT